MAKLTRKIAFSIILAGFFVVTVFIALDYGNIDTASYIIFSIIAVYLLLFGFAMGSNFASPVRKILEKAVELAKGNLSSRVYLKSGDELGELAKTLNELAEKLEADKAAIETTERGVDIKVRARTEALEETITALEQKVKNRTIELDKIINDLQKLQETVKARELEISGLKTQIENLKPKQRAIKKTKNDARAS